MMYLMIITSHKNNMYANMEFIMICLEAMQTGLHIKIELKTP